MNNKGKGNKKFFRVIFAMDIAFIALVLFLRNFFVNGNVTSESMEPTLMTNQMALSIRYDAEKLQRGDIITFYYDDENGKELFVKRVIGLEGDVIKLINGCVYLNDELLVEEYIPEGVMTYAYDEYMFTVGEDELFVLGDNREHSFDSRYFGCISTDDYKFKVIHY